MNASKRLTLGESAHYAICVQGLIEERLFTLFPNMNFAWHHEQGATTLIGQVTDQAALHGLLVTIRDLGLPLLSVLYLEKRG